MTEVKVYGNKRMLVETEFDEKTYKLKPGQELLAKNLRLQRYAKNRKKEPKWIVDILKEIVIQKCRDDPQIMLTQPCINFREYLEDLMIDLFKTGKYDIDDDESFILKKDYDDKVRKEKSKTRAANLGKIAIQKRIKAIKGAPPEEIQEKTILRIIVPFDKLQNVGKVNSLEDTATKYYDETLKLLEQLFPPIGGLESTVVSDFKKQYTEGKLIH